MNKNLIIVLGLIFIYYAYIKKRKDAPCLSDDGIRRIAVQESTKLFQKYKDETTQITKDLESKIIQEITVDTYENAVPYFTGNVSRIIYVRSDTTYNEGDKSWYRYTPGFGVAKLGIDYNYTEQ